MAAMNMEPPPRLREDGLTLLQFNTWTEALELYLAQDPRTAAFLSHNPYSSWEPMAAHPEQILRPAGADTAEDLPLRRSELQTVLHLVAEAVDARHYAMVTRHSTSLQWIYDQLRDSYHLQPPGVTLLSVVGLRYEPSSSSVASLFSQYRDIVVDSLESKEEMMGPCLEDLILLNVLSLVDSRLPAHVSNVYRHGMSKDNRRLSDYRQAHFV
jgi:hypothetical protein